MLAKLLNPESDDWDSHHGIQMELNVSTLPPKVLDKNSHFMLQYSLSMRKINYRTSAYKLQWEAQKLYTELP